MGRRIVKSGSAAGTGTQNRRHCSGRCGHPHTVLAPASLGPRAYVSSGLREAFANPVPASNPSVYVGAMIYMRKTILAVCLVGFVGGVAYLNKPDPKYKSIHVVPNELVRLETADAIKDMQNAVAHNDYKFLAVDGYASMVPGVTEEEYRNILETDEARSIEGTSDCIESDEQLRLQPIAMEYAKNYNVALHGWFDKHPEIAKKIHFKPSQS